MRAPDAGKGRMEAALADAAAWRFLALLMERPRAGWIEEIRALSREVPDGELRAAAEEAERATEGEYLKIIGPGGRVSPREVSYCGRRDPAAVLADLSAFHRAFSWTPRAEDPMDHVSVEAGFAGYLRLKEAYAIARGSLAEAATAAEAMDLFVESHLRNLAGPMARRLETGGASWLSRAARALVARAGDRTDSLPLLPDDFTEAGLCCPGDEPAAT